METWKTIPCAPRYEASSLGRVRNAETLHVMKPKVGFGGYLALCLRPEPGLKLYRKVHQLVAEAFLGPRPFPGALVAHWDGSRTNNTPTNLRWATSKENHADRERHGRTARGSRNGTALLDEKTVREIRSLLARGAKQADLADRFGVCRSQISHIKTRKYWSHL